MSDRNSRTKQQAAVAGNAYIAPIDDLAPNGWNYNVQSSAVFSKLCKAITRHGFTKPIIVCQEPFAARSPNALKIIDGEHRWRAAKLLGMMTVPVVDLGIIPDERAKELTIILNELAGEPDEGRLSDLLRDVATTSTVQDLLDVMPYAPSQLDAYLSAVDFGFTRLPEDSALPEPVAPKKAAKLSLSFKGQQAEELRQLCDGLRMDPETAIVNAARARAARRNK